MKMGPVMIVLVTVFIFLSLTSTIPGYCVQSGELQLAADIPAIDTGIPTVTPEQAVDKVKRIVISIHNSAVEISPYLTLLIIVIGGILGILIKSARAAILWAIIAMLLILWAPEIIGLVEFLKTV
ncbi:hypothetical protein SAMN05660649_04833 [Desulfotomaculum arcticum]|uniref:TrbC/VIRB2 family protein n=1 Tax=Desulfotruncus arcticus DSM 17038 TaxID=1121424 RepID=A0A1I2Z965_9FIRM|nr:hypothetical protein [Desulfotruncus arcticus]SFH34448.1 hypothetical protein SAMN05660649_04833 [Desulfotomaculum arcticum] [Desulfotruncus arcticus DSM 17038]